MNLPTLVDMTNKTAAQLENMLAAAHAFGSTRTIERIEAELNRREDDAREATSTRALPWASLPQPSNA